MRTHPPHASPIRSEPLYRRIKKGFLSNDDIKETISISAISRFSRAPDVHLVPVLVHLRRARHAQRACAAPLATRGRGPQTSANGNPPTFSAM